MNKATDCPYRKPKYRDRSDDWQCCIADACKEFGATIQSVA
jgi:hypothetical protein